MPDLGRKGDRSQSGRCLWHRHRRDGDGHDDFATIFHYDAVFGTVLNRFVVQAILGVPLTVYGEGGQTRGFLNIRDTLQCVELAALNPARCRANSGCSISSLNSFPCRISATRVQRVAQKRGLNVSIDHLSNPRIEAEQHYYNAKHSRLQDLGLVPHLLDDAVVDHMLEVAETYRGRIDEAVVQPHVKWKSK